MNRLLAVAAGLTMLAGGSGCSLIFVHGPPKDHRERLEIDCTQSVAMERLAPSFELFETPVGGRNTKAERFAV